MRHEAEYQFLRQLCQRCNLQTLLITDVSFPPWRIDRGLRSLLRQSTIQDLTVVLNRISSLQPGTVYRTADRYLCNYLFFALPDCDTKTVFLVGPYLSAPVTREELLELAEDWGMPAAEFQHLENYFSQLPVLTHSDPLLAACYLFAEQVWVTQDALAVVDVDMPKEPESATVPVPEDLSHQPSSTALNMQMLETRYRMENEIMRTISQGLIHKVEQFTVHITDLAFERRLTDPVRNLKNYAITMNTLLRKAAEAGGVHPYYLDKTSSAFVHRIEALTTIEAAKALMVEMLKSYCRLVNQHSTSRYSLPIQRMIVYINENLQRDLSLNTLASLQNMNPSYLSALFRKETGETLTDHVCRKRMEQAQRLLATTKLQVQTIAQHCGISDVNYFSRLFRRHTSMTPTDYRASLSSAAGKRR